MVELQESEQDRVDTQGAYTRDLWPWWFHWSKDSRANSWVTAHIFAVCSNRTSARLMVSRLSKQKPNSEWCMEINSPTVPRERSVVPLLMVWMSRCINTNGQIVNRTEKKNKAHCVGAQVPIIWEDQYQYRSISISVACFVVKARLGWGVRTLRSMIFQTPEKKTLKKAIIHDSTHHPQVCFIAGTGQNQRWFGWFWAQSDFHHAHKQGFKERKKILKTVLSVLVSKVWNEQGFLCKSKHTDFCGRVAVCKNMSVQILVTGILGKMYFLIYYYINHKNGKIGLNLINITFWILNLPGC